jgi:hypothetical protein
MPERQRRAAAVLAAVPAPAHDSRVLDVQCTHSHHVAAVFTTADGPVVQTHRGRHAHGQRDRVDTPHHGHPTSAWTDFVDAGPLADDKLPAWCECGPWTLSRAELAAWVAAGEGRVVLESGS